MSMTKRCKLIRAPRVLRELPPQTETEAIVRLADIMPSVVKELIHLNNKSRKSRNNHEKVY